MGKVVGYNSYYGNYDDATDILVSKISLNNSDFTIVLCGDSASGKDTIQKQLIQELGYNKIITYTTRLPRDVETDGVDYNFITNEQFNKWIEWNFFAEYDEYSQGRLYGSSKESYLEGNRVIILTPNGIKSIKKTLDNRNIITIYVKTSLGTRIKRYIDRIGVDKFNFDDKNEIMSRVERDFGMFLGIEKEVDLVVNGDDSLNNIIENIKEHIEKRKTEREDLMWS